MEPVLKQREGNYMIEVYRDEDAPNPRKAWDPACHMVVSSRHVETEMDGADDAPRINQFKYNDMRKKIFWGAAAVAVLLACYALVEMLIAFMWLCHYSGVPM